MRSNTTGDMEKIMLSQNVATWKAQKAQSEERDRMMEENCQWLLPLKSDACQERLGDGERMPSGRKDRRWNGTRDKKEGKGNVTRGGRAFWKEESSLS